MSGRRLKIAAWAVVAGFWALELAEALTGSRFVTPMDFLLDCATACATLACTAWTLLDRFILRRGNDRQREDDYFRTLEAITAGAFASLQERSDHDGDGIRAS